MRQCMRDGIDEEQLFLYADPELGWWHAPRMPDYPAGHSDVGTARDPAAGFPARLPPRHARGRGRIARAGRAPGGDRARLHTPHVGVVDTQRKRLRGCAPGLRRLVRSCGSGWRRLLPPHARGRRRHARAHQGVAARAVADDPRHRRPPGARDLAGHLPLRTPRPWLLAAVDGHFVGRTPLTISIVPSGVRMRSITDTRFSPDSRRNSGSFPATLLDVLRNPSSSWTFRNAIRISRS